MLIEQLPILSLSLQDLRTADSIALVDLSTYVSIPDASHLSLQITPPGYDTVNVAFVPNTVNIYKCVDLGITCGDSGCTPLPDGIYEVVYSVIPDTGQTFPASSVDLKFIKIDHIKCKYQHAFLKIDLNCVCHDHSWNKYIDELMRIKLYIDGSVAECNNSNYNLSYEYYTKANQMLDRIGCNQLFKKGCWPKKPLGCNIC